MGLEVNGSNNINNTEGRESSGNNVQKDMKLNTIWDVDRYGNNNGNLNEEDFAIARSKNLDAKIKEKLESLYIEFVDTFFPNMGREVGNHIISEYSIPRLDGNTDTRTFVRDKATGKTLLEKSTQIIDEGDGLTTVKVNIKRYNGDSVKENNVEFQYNQEALEDYIINVATDAHGNDIKYYDSIPEIRNIPESERTEEQQALLNEFNDMIKYVIDAGVDYGVDPKAILSIIQQEVGFDGLDERATGPNGKGHMQLTSAPVQDYLGYAGDKKYHQIKEWVYGPEVKELLSSRGFDPDQAQTQQQRNELYNDIREYLTKNEDMEFNIRLGTLVFRNYLNRANGDVKEAAKNYNGSSLKEYYSKNVMKYNKILSDTVPQDTTYRYIASRIPRD